MVENSPKILASQRKSKKSLDMDRKVAYCIESYTWKYM